METKDYTKFKTLATNRNLKPSIVKKIVQSVKEWGIIPGRPILVDSEFNVVDGQHRLEAYKQLGLAVPYEILTGDIISKTIALNANQSPWQVKDYIESYAEQGIDCYRKLLKFEEKYKLGVSNNISICVSNKSSMTKEIKRGQEFEIMDDANEIAEYIISLDALSFYKTDKFVKAIIILFKKANSGQLAILKTNALRINRCANVVDYLTVFENILNYKKRGGNILSLV